MPTCISTPMGVHAVKPHLHWLVCTPLHSHVPTLNINVPVIITSNHLYQRHLYCFILSRKAPMRPGPPHELHLSHYDHNLIWLPASVCHGREGRQREGSVLVGESLHRDYSHHSRLGNRVSTRNQKPTWCLFQRTTRVTYSHQQGPTSQSSPK